MAASSRRAARARRRRGPARLATSRTTSPAAGSRAAAHRPAAAVGTGNGPTCGVSDLGQPEPAEDRRSATSQTRPSSATVASSHCRPPTTDHQRGRPRPRSVPSTAWSSASEIVGARRAPRRRARRRPTTRAARRRPGRPAGGSPARPERAATGSAPGTELRRNASSRLSDRRSSASSAPGASRPTAGAATGPAGTRATHRVTGQPPAAIAPRLVVLLDRVQDRRYAGRLRPAPRPAPAPLAAQPDPPRGRPPTSASAAPTASRSADSRSRAARAGVHGVGDQRPQLRHAGAGQRRGDEDLLAPRARLGRAAGPGRAGTPRRPRGAAGRPG